MLKKKKPVTPSQRSMVSVVNKELFKGKPHRSLTTSKKKIDGRNSLGRVTVRHRGGGHKRQYRLVDFKRDKFDVLAKVERIEYDPNRSAHIALLCYQDGERRYIIAPVGIKVGMTVVSGLSTPIKVGNSLPLKNIPIGTVIHCIELKIGAGAKIARSAGCSAQLLGREGAYARVRLKSGEIRLIHVECRATVGCVGNSDNNLRKYGKAGVKRWLGIRPTVRGVAMNPIDHPHGGGEGKTAAGRHPVSPTSVLAKGKRTRNNKRTDKFIMRRRTK